ncbi:hypothetical protein I302_108276 [Kwoniella bestiolae CBS 10118]|uniref:Uncharacterized protein n=1 Tax=Kwoniella bestiolae CBS 10118 TaxID=1296100 RepID=A0A1B9FW58_9TREE|nr:hypothetical protein I302_07356 [Kwoniella bestiolae CBS 10118]OCF23006.1 hypothetical protein I302_07356 [Kwoniella bestiolae CBS 10118]
MPTKVHVPRSMSRSGTGERRREAVLGEIINTSRAITEAKSSSFASMDESKLNKMEKYKDDLIWRMYGLTMQYGVDHGIKFIQDKLDEYTKLGGRRDPVSVLEDFDTLRQPMKNLYRRHIEKVIGSLRDQEDNADIDESTEDIRKRRRKYDQDWLLRSKAWCDVDESSITFILEGWDDLDNSGPALRTNFTFIGLVFPHESSLSPNTYLSGA